MLQCCLMLMQSVCFEGDAGTQGTVNKHTSFRACLLAQTQSRSLSPVTHSGKPYCLVPQNTCNTGGVRHAKTPSIAMSFMNVVSAAQFSEAFAVSHRFLFVMIAWRRKSFVNGGEASRFRMMSWHRQPPFPLAR